MSQIQIQQTTTSSIPLGSSNQQSSSGNQQLDSSNQPWGRPVSPTGGFGNFGGRPFNWRPEQTTTYLWPGATSISRRNAHRGGVSWNTGNQEGYSEEEAEEPRRTSRRNTPRRIPTERGNPNGAPDGDGDGNNGNNNGNNDDNNNNNNNNQRNNQNQDDDGRRAMFEL